MDIEGANNDDMSRMVIYGDHQWILRAVYEREMSYLQRESFTLGEEYYLTILHLDGGVPDSLFEFFCFIIKKNYD